MTNVRVYNNGEIDKDQTAALRERQVPDEEELKATLAAADYLPNDYFRLRAKAILSIARLYGKRRSEIATIFLNETEIKNDKLYITFEIRKKHKLGLYQYIKMLNKNNDPVLSTLTYEQLRENWLEWQHTEAGYKVKTVKRKKTTPLTDIYAQHIANYLTFMKKTHPKSVYLFPSGRCVFGTDNYTFDYRKPINGQTVRLILKPLNQKLWPHLLRKLKGTKTAEKYGRTLESVFHVKETLDLARTETAMNYIQGLPREEVSTEVS